MIVYLRLSGFYLDHTVSSSRPVVVVKDKEVLDVDASASSRGVVVGMSQREAKAILGEAKFVQWCADDHLDRQRQWLGVCTEFSDVIEPEEQHTAYVDLVGHPDPLDIHERLVGRLEEVAGASIKVESGIARVKWLAKAALAAGDSSRLAYRAPLTFLENLPTLMLAPIAQEHRERLCFLGYPRVGQVAGLPLEVLQTQFGEQGLPIHRAAKGGRAERVQARYPQRCVAARFTFESPVESQDALDHGLADLSERLARKLCADDLQGYDLRVFWGCEEGGEVLYERHFAKPMQSVASVRFGLKLLVQSPQATMEEGGFANRLVTLRAQMPNLAPATRKQGNLYTLRSNEQAFAAEMAVDQVRQTFGSDAMLLGAQMLEPRRKRVLKVWKDAIGWS